MRLDLDRNSSVPLYMQLKEQIRRSIDSGQLVDGEPLPTEQALCDQLGLSRYTVRQALGELAKDGYIEKIQGKGAFVSKVSLEKRRGMSAPAIGLVVPYTNDFYTSNIIRGVESVVRTAGYNLIFSNSNNHPEQEEQIIWRLRSDGVKGMVLFPCEDTVYSATVAELKSQGFPIVLVDREFRTLDCPCVIADNVAGAEVAVDHLISLGHERIAFAMTSFGQTSSVQDRLLGYRTALAKHRMQWDQDMVIVYTPKLIEAAADTTDHLAPIRRFLSTDDRASAIFAVNDFVAMDVLRAASEVGLSVPGVLSVVGFDDIPIVAGLPIPLTTIAQPQLEIGRTAAQMLLGIVNGRAPEEPKVVLPVRIVIRESSGRCAACYR